MQTSMLKIHSNNSQPRLTFPSETLIHPAILCHANLSKHVHHTYAGSKRIRHIKQKASIKMCFYEAGIWNGEGKDCCEVVLWEAVKTVCSHACKQVHKNTPTQFSMKSSSLYSHNWDWCNRSKDLFRDTNLHSSTLFSACFFPHHAVQYSMVWLPSSSHSMFFFCDVSYTLAKYPC